MPDAVAHQLRARAASAPDRCALRVYGGKFGAHGRIADWIIRHFPPHQTYVEPFAGALSVLLRKSPAPIEFANDADGRVVNFFRILRERPDELIEAIQLTPLARAELDLSSSEAADPVEDARRLYVRSLQGRGGATRACHPGWRYEILPLRGARIKRQWRDLHHLLTIADRLLDVQFECGDALEVIPRLDSPATLFYVDPPYLETVRNHRWSRHAYRHELNTEEEHRRLAEVLHAVQGMVVLSGYWSELYAELYETWPQVSFRSIRDGGTSQSEILWLNPEASGRQRQTTLDFREATGA